MTHDEPLLVFSHLRWDFVFQRPQHLMSRFAKRRRVIFFEEPGHATSGDSYLEMSLPQPGVLVCRPHTPSDKPGFHDQQIPYLQELVQKLVSREGLSDYALWFYTPMALPLIQSLEPRAIIYDCMDELSAFANAPLQMLQREAALLKAADIVFTGGPSLYRAKKDRHSNAHCFSSSVDAQHFGSARGAVDEPADQYGIAHPRLGFFGVIDERIDLDLLAKLADERPGYNIVMLGPVVKIEPATLPQRANLHYLGQKDYAELPAYLAGWDVCLLPFALNNSTRFISPTKTLEYMAAAKPIVSTPITDVAESYADVVYIAQGADFIAACDRALDEDAATRQEQQKKMAAVLANTSWDATAERMSDVIAAAIEANAERTAIAKKIAPNDAAVGPVAATSNVASLDKKSTQEPINVVIGAGPTGLSTVYHLGGDTLLVERNERVGGWCRSISDAGFTFDYAGHIMFSNDAYVHELYKVLLGENVHWQDREAWIFSKNVYTRYPFQGALYGLPADVVRECIVGAVEAKIENLKSMLQASNESVTPIGAVAEACAEDVGEIKDCCGDGVLESTALGPPAGSPERRLRPRNFDDFIYKVWGAGIAKHFAIPYNRKLWAVPLNEMETSWLGGRVPEPNLDEMIEGALSPAPKPMGPNARFGYPLRGGFQALMNGFLPHLKHAPRLNTEVTAVSPSRHTVTLNGSETIPYRTLVSTMPLPLLIDAIGDEAPANVRAAADGLRYVSVRCVNIAVNREQITDKHWIYYPEETVFHRIFVQGNASPHCNAPGGFGFTCEITYSSYKPLPADGDELIQRCIDDCIKVGFIRADDEIRVANQVDMPFAYVVYDHARRRNVALIRDWLKTRDIVLAGRYSEWEYYNSDHAFIAGKKAAETVQAIETESGISKAS